MKPWVAFVLLLTASVHADVVSYSVRPSATDPAIRTFDDPHVFYIDRDIVIEDRQNRPADRHQLLVFLEGTYGKGQGAKAFLTLAASLGYHVISLMYPDDLSASTCDNDPNPAGFELFRMAVIQGGNAAMKAGRQPFSVERSESIENRLIKLLSYLQRIRPRERWGQFLNQDGSIRWESIAVGGQSQGGGHAALIGVKHPVARVLCFGSPKDFSRRYGNPAAWLTEPSATPSDRFFAFNHVQDPKGCTPEQLYQNLRTLVGDFAAQPAQVDSESAPFHHARVLYTAFPPVTISDNKSEAATEAHMAGINSRYAERWLAVWTYMLTEPVQ